MNRKTENAKSRRPKTYGPLPDGLRLRGTRIVGRLNPVMALVLAPGFAFAATVPVHATIDNTATASGTYGEQMVQADAATLNLDVEPAKASLSVSSVGVLDASGGAESDAADGGDTISLSVTVTNSGNVSVRAVHPADAAFLANGETATGTLADFEPASADIEPGASQVFTALYTLSVDDVYRAAGTEGGITASIGASGAVAAGDITADPVAAKVDVDANPRLEISKDAVIAKGDGNTGDDIEAGDLVTYTYTVTNTGNVAINGITITDEHEGTALTSSKIANSSEGPFDETQSVADPLGVSADESGVNGTWDVLGAGGAVTFTFRHVVTQAEFEAQ